MCEEGASADLDRDRATALVDQIPQGGRTERQHLCRALIVILDFRFRAHASNMDAPFPVRPRENLAT